MSTEIYEILDSYYDGGEFYTDMKLEKQELEDLANPEDEIYYDPNTKHMILKKFSPYQNY